MSLIELDFAKTMLHLGCFAKRKLRWNLHALLRDGDGGSGWPGRRKGLVNQ